MIAWVQNGVHLGRLHTAWRLVCIGHAFFLNSDTLFPFFTRHFHAFLVPISWKEEVLQARWGFLRYCLKSAWPALFLRQMSAWAQLLGGSIEHFTCPVWPRSTRGTVLFFFDSGRLVFVIGLHVRTMVGEAFDVPYLWFAGRLCQGSSQYTSGWRIWQDLFVLL
ncbi:hypothetical protein K504DRAFT_139909 [Pleomassaria siparia CBS 279.74]|uniref:Uncharacterized protein n=1 Tax=Pleomassaria siparia CBS 279.74 TaxID=1314801 RepID=A0A6G1KL63_9PLEO|nr:hypothetical protein K504DRAFT_139909 [Pleomassaria siparia CBS 279.74]